MLVIAVHVVIHSTVHAYCLAQPSIRVLSAPLLAGNSRQSFLPQSSLPALFPIRYTHPLGSSSYSERGTIEEKPCPSIMVVPYSRHRLYISLTSSDSHISSPPIRSRRSPSILDTRISLQKPQETEPWKTSIPLPAPRSRRSSLGVTPTTQSPFSRSPRRSSATPENNWPSCRRLTMR